MANAVSIIQQLLQGLALIGNAATSAVKAVLAYFRLNILEYAINLAQYYL